MMRVFNKGQITNFVAVGILLSLGACLGSEGNAASEGTNITAGIDPSNTTDELKEGTINRYYSDARVATAPAVTALSTQLTAQALSNPSVDGQILTGTAAGAKTWNYVTQALRPTREMSIMEDWIAGTTAGTSSWTVTPTGTAAAAILLTAALPSPDPYRPGLVRLDTGTTATGRVHVGLGTDHMVVGGGALYFESSVYLPSLSDGSNTYKARIGFGDTTAGAYNDGIWFEAIGNYWYRTTQSTSISNLTQTSTAVSVQALTWTKLAILVSADGTSAEFFINGASVGTNSTNMPGPTRQFSPMFAIVKSVGIASSFMVMDYALIRQVFSVNR